MRGAGVPDTCRSSFACSCAIPVRVAASLRRSWVCRARRRRCVGEVGLALAAFGFELAALGLDVDLGPVLPEQLAMAAAPRRKARTEWVRGGARATRVRSGGRVAARCADGRPPPASRAMSIAVSAAFTALCAADAQARFGVRHRQGHRRGQRQRRRRRRRELPTDRQLPGAGADAAGAAPRSVRAGWMDRALSGPARTRTALRHSARRSGPRDRRRRLGGGRQRRQRRWRCPTSRARGGWARH